ncbi:MAG: mechanosensitive ion channel [Nitrospinae bacterium]|nr:mechanosensitive ion channel [Nitrospinota bacterium]
MDFKIEVEMWKETFISVIGKLWTEIALFTPNLVGALVILILGYFVSKLLKVIVSTFLRKIQIDLASEKVGIKESLSKTGITITPSEIVGKIVFWIFMLTFVISAAETLGLEQVSQTIDSFVLYLPKVLGASLIAVIGLVLAHFVKDLVRNGVEGFGVEYGKPLANFAFGIMVFVIGVLTLEQLEIKTALLNSVLEITMIASGLALALSLGLGTKEVSKNIISGVYARDTFKSGLPIQFENDEGVVEEIGTVTSRVRSKNGELVFIPNSVLIESKVRGQKDSKGFFNF